LGESPRGAELQPRAGRGTVTPTVRTVDALVGDLGDADVNLRASALAELVRRGHEATPALLAALDCADPNLRIQSARGLSEIADPVCAELFVRLLNDDDERIRAYAARGLARLRDLHALDALVRTIDDFPDVLRQPFTPSTDELIALGPSALPSVVPLLDAPDATTRVRAFLVIRQVLSALPGTGDWHALWRQLGSYQPTAPGPQREHAARQWRNWITDHFPGS
jgi:HEAT repeat protein